MKYVQYITLALPLLCGWGISSSSQAVDLNWEETLLCAAADQLFTSTKPTLGLQGFVDSCNLLDKSQLNPDFFSLCDVMAEFNDNGVSNPPVICTALKKKQLSLPTCITAVLKMHKWPELKEIRLSMRFSDVLYAAGVYDCEKYHAFMRYISFSNMEASIEGIHWNAENSYLRYCEKTRLNNNYLNLNCSCNFYKGHDGAVNYAMGCESVNEDIDNDPLGLTDFNEGREPVSEDIYDGDPLGLFDEL